MRKTLVIALRDYLAAVKTKSFLVGLILMPILMGGGIIVGRLAQDMKDTREKRVKVIDHTAPTDAQLAQAAREPATQPTTRPAGPAATGITGFLAGAAARSLGLDDLFASDPSGGGKPLYQVLIDEAQQRNESLRNEAGELTDAPFVIEHVPLPNDDPATLDRIRFELSEEIRDGELFAFIEIGPAVIATPPPALRDGTAEVAEDAIGAAATVGDEAQDSNALAEMTEGDRPIVEPDEADEVGSVFGDDAQAAMIDRYGIRYTSESTTYMALQQWIQQTLTPEIYQRRIASAGLPPTRVMSLVVPPVVQQRAMAIETADGQIAYEPDPNPITSFVIPIFSIFLIFTVVMTAASPLTTNIVEEKQLRIAEVLLGSVTPFELMLGKLLGGVGVSLTLAAIYFAGGLYAAAEFDALSAVTPSIVAWFLVFAALATLMYGALFVAAGAAVSNLKEAQNMLTPIILIVVAPMMVFVNVLQNPDGPLARFITWFPLTTPVGAVLRQSIPPGIDTTTKIFAAALSLATTLVLVWLAGRIFRHGMLRSEKGAAFGEMIRWVTRG